MGSEITFLSYSRSDLDFVLKLAKDLRKIGTNVWLDKLDVSFGTRWDLAVEKALKDSYRMLVVLTPDSVSSFNVMDEVSYALEKDKNIIPILYKPCEIPFRLRRFQYINFTENYDDALKNLLSALHPESGATIPDQKVISVINGQMSENRLDNSVGLQTGNHALAGINTKAKNKNHTISKIDIGKPYQGGIIFYIDESGQHGLIAAPFDQSSGIQWYNGSYNEISTDKEIGAGKRNSNIIVANQGTGNYAAKLCSDLVLNGYNDWFLPSQDELNQLYLYQNKVGGFAGFYWSSSSKYFYNAAGVSFVDSKVAWGQGFTKGIVNLRDKSAKTGRVRAIRAF